MQQQTDAAAELELAMLQINQLQEELEYYYLQNIKLQEQGSDSPKSNAHPDASSADVAAPTAVALKLLRKIRLSDSNHKNSAENNYNQHLVQQLESLKKSSQHSEEKVAEVVQQNTGLVAELDNKNQQIDQLNSANKVLITDNAKQQQYFDELESSHRRMVSEKNSLIAQVAERGSQNELLLLQIAQLQEELEIEFASRSTEIGRLTAIIEQLTAAQLVLEASKETSEQNNAQLKIEVTESTDSNKSLSLEVSKNLEQISALTQTVSRLTSEASVLEVNAAQLQSKQKKLADALSHKDDQIATITKQRDEQAHWHQENKSWAEALQKQADIEKNRANDLELKKSTIESRVLELESVISNLEAQKQEQTYRQAMLDQEIVSAEAQIELIKDVVLREKSF